MCGNLVGCYMGMLMGDQILQNLIPLAGMIAGRRGHGFHLKYEIEIQFHI